ncbi:hypothetical protein GCM10023307_03490 [Lysobacter hankyongensis]|uniref:Carrier domain-containing protein n=2 Tax=Lysobacter hankyongensis TaxID=1176535 RepID=A0ABP9ALG7_9GAMM
MVSIRELLSSAEKQGARFWLSEGVLYYKSPADGRVPAELDAIRSRKNEVVAFLSALGAPETPPPLASIPRPATLPLSFAQERMWFLSQLQGFKSAYTMAVAWRLQGALDRSALELALQRLVQRHESLRTRFATIDGQPCQCIDDAPDFALRVRDIGATTSGAFGGADPELRLRRGFADAIAEPFDIESDLLFRATLFVEHAQSHVLLLTLHHIIGDGWSLGILAGELGALYACALDPAVPPPAPPVLQYADHTLQQRERLQGETLEKQLSYWKTHLANPPEPLELPTLRQRPATPDFVGAVHRFSFDRPMADAIREFCRREKVTLFMFMLTAFKCVLSRWSGQTDLCVGTPIASRTDPALESVVGFFVSTVALRTDLSACDSFRAALRSVKSNSIEAFRNQDVPFDLIVKTLQPGRDLYKTPYFQTMFTMEIGADASPEMPGLHATSVSVETGTAAFDLSLAIRQLESGLEGVIEYATALFDDADIGRFAGHLRTFVAEAIATPEAPIAALPILAEGEGEALLGRPLPVVAPAPACNVLSMFDAQVRVRPDAVAVVCESETLTYRELDQRANRLAHHLREFGVGPESIVGIFLERSTSVVIATLAVLKAGAAYLPLDPMYPAERLEYILGDAKAQVLITQTSLIGALPPVACPILTIDDVVQRLADRPDTAPIVPFSIDQLAYVIYTSGSTGRPKGTLITHRNLVRLFTATESCFRFDEHDVWTLFHSHAFDFSVWEIFGPLVYGGRIVVVPYLVTRSPERFHDLLEEQGVTVLNQTPSAFRMLMRAAEQKPASSRLHRLKHVIFGGEALDPRSIAAWYAMYPDDAPRLVNMYGITETTVHVTFRALTREDTLRAGSCIGLPMDDLRIYVLDEYRRPCPMGVYGELYVAGPGLARGYLNRPELTAERFVRNPFAADGNERMYKTGDVGRWVAPDEIEYLGRNDSQVKLRGFRIELGEIDASLLKVPGVSEAVTRVVTLDADDQRLVAWVVGKAGFDLDGRAVAAQLRELLPAYMVPSAIVTLERMPLTVNGKIDLRALPLPRHQEPAGTVEAVAPRTATERALAAIWSEVLDVPVSVRDNFFAIGGDSIRAVQVVRAARAQNLDCSVELLFQAQTVEDMAKAMLDAAPALRAPPVESLPGTTLAAQDLRAGIVDVYPATDMQRIMIEANTAGAAAGLAYYHVQQSFRFVDDQPSPEAMRCAVAAMVAAQPVLRTMFVRDAEGRLFQAIRSDAAVPFFVHDLSPLDDAGREEAVRGLILADRASSFDAFGARAELLRFHWIRLAADRFELLMSIHHAIDDGWGNGYFLQSLFDLYRRIKTGEVVRIVPAANVFKEHVAILHDASRSERDGRFWSTLDLPVSRWPRDPGACPAPQPRCASRRLSAERMHALRVRARNAGVSLKALFLRHYARAIGTVLSLDAPTIGVVANGRTDRLSDPLNSLGLFWNLVPFATPATAGSDDEDLRAVQRRLIEIEPHANHPLGEIESSHRTASLFDATFNFVNFHNLVRFDEDGRLSLLRETSLDRFHYPMNLFVSAGADEQGGTLHVEYEGRILDSAWMEAWLDAYVERLTK